MKHLIKALKHKLGVCNKQRKGYRYCKGANNYQECGE